MRKEIHGSGWVLEVSLTPCLKRPVGLNMGAKLIRLGKGPCSKKFDPEEPGMKLLREPWLWSKAIQVSCGTGTGLPSG